MIQRHFLYVSLSDMYQHQKLNEMNIECKSESIYTFVCFSDFRVDFSRCIFENESSLLLFNDSVYTYAQIY